MTWLDLHNDLGALRERLAQQGMASWQDLSPTWSVLAERFVRLDQRHGAAVFQATKAFAQGLALPSLSPIERFLFWLRVDFAEDVAHSLHVAAQTNRVSHPLQDREASLHWLLVDLWEQCGCGAMTGMIESLRDAWPRDTDSGKN